MMTELTNPNHYNQTPRRRAEFITPPNVLKQKVGSGGLGEDILDKAQALLENNSVDFQPLADIYLRNLKNGITGAKSFSEADDTEYVISTMIYPGMQLKANGGMFHYPLVTGIADRLIQFLEVIETPDRKVLEIVTAFHSTIEMVIKGRIQGDGGAHGRILVKALDDACERYFEKFGDNVDMSVL